MSCHVKWLAARFHRTQKPNTVKDEEHVQFYTEDWNVSREVVLKAMIRFLVPALLPGKPAMFYRSKWTGFEKSVSWLAMCHNLLKPTILQYLDGDSAISSSAGQAAEAGSGSALQDAPDGAQAVQPEAVLEQQMNTVTSDFDWTVFKQQMKKKLRAWVVTNPAAVLLVISTALSVIQRLLHRMLRDGSTQWERAEKAKAARGEERTYPVLEAARQTGLVTFRDQLNDTFHRLIVGVPRSSHSQPVQLLMFRLLSSLACATEHYIGVPWRSYPVRLFEALDGSFSFLEADPCCLCPLSQLLREHFNEDTVLEPDFRQLMCTLASMFQLDIFDVECRHAATRRLTTIRSTQAPTAQLVTVSADFVCRNNSIDRQESLIQKPDFQEKLNKQEPPEPESSNTAKKKSNRANAWNAFLSEHCRKRFSDPDRPMKSLAEQFRELSDEEKQEYQKIADIAKLGREFGHSKPYGDRSGASSSSNALVPAGHSSRL